MNQFTSFIPRFTRQQLLCFLLGLGVGVLLFGLVRFVFQPEQGVHYHANFAVFINGQRQEFKGPAYYQEVAACASKERPQDRVHMHDNISHVVHVHEDLMTWGNFFTVLGWSLHEKSLFDGTTAYVDGRGGELKFILNGQPVLSVANEIIKSEDRLLISYGTEDIASAQTQFSQLESDAAEYNQRQDPSSCKGAEELTVWQRLQRAFWFTN